MLTCIRMVPFDLLTEWWTFSRPHPHSCCRGSDSSPCHRRPWSVSKPCAEACCCGCCSCTCRSGSSEEDPWPPSARRSPYSDSWRWWRSGRETEQGGQGTRSLRYIRRYRYFSVYLRLNTGLLRVGEIHDCWEFFFSFFIKSSEKHKQNSFHLCCVWLAAEVSDISKSHEIEIKTTCNCMVTQHWGISEELFLFGSFEQTDPLINWLLTKAYMQSLSSIVFLHLFPQQLSLYLDLIPHNCELTIYICSTSHCRANMWHVTSSY